MQRKECDSLQKNLDILTQKLEQEQLVNANLNKGIQKQKEKQKTEISTLKSNDECYKAYTGISVKIAGKDPLQESCRRLGEATRRLREEALNDDDRTHAMISRLRSLHV